MRLLYRLLIVLYSFQIHHAITFNSCRFVGTFYKNHSNIFELDKDQTSLTVRPLYALSNQSFSFINQSLSIGIIYRLADTYLVPVPLLFECLQSERIYAPIDCEFTVVDTRSDLSIRTTESTRTSTVPLHFRDYSSSKSILLRGAYFKQSTIALRNCRLSTKENLFISNTFHLHIEFEQTINSPCRHQCTHSQLYECSPLSNTCQCRLETIGRLCVDTELGSNCSLTPERCRRICRASQQIRTGEIDHDCQCPLGTQRILSTNIHHCESPASSECDNNELIATCPKDYICRQNRCVHTKAFVRVNESILSLPFILIALLIGAFLIILILILGLLKMRSIKCIKFVHPYVLSNNSSPTTITRLPSLSSPCSTLSSSSSKPVKSTTTNKICEKYTKIDLFK